MRNLIERIKKRIDKEWSFQEGCREEAKRNNKRKDVNEIGGIMDGLNIAGSFINEESAKEPQKCTYSDKQMIVCKTNKGHFAVRPITWAGIWDINGNINEFGVNHVAIFAYEKDANRYVNIINNQPQVQPICCGCTYDYENGYLDARLKADGWTKQPIVRSKNELIDVLVHVDCDDCPVRNNCMGCFYTTDKECREHLSNYLTGKKV